jgi:hypothetical protein
MKGNKLEPKDKAGNLVHGRRSNLLKQFGACAKCPVRDYCTHKDLLSENQKERGCEDIRNLYLENVRIWKKPYLIAARNAADIKTRIQLQNLKDGISQDLASKKWQALMKLELEYLKMAERMAKAGMTKNIKVEHSFVGKEDIIEMDTSAYESDTLTDEKPTVHGNLSDEKYEEMKKKEEEQ